eukprot:6476487-Amphidinium_carterae.1
MALPYSCSPTIAFIPSSQTSSGSEDVLDVLPYSGLTEEPDDQDAGKELVHGGMMSGASSRDHRSRSPHHGACNIRRDIAFPSWALSGEDATMEQLALHLHLEGTSCGIISIPSTWTTADIQWMLARHLAIPEHWLDFTWVDNEVSIEVTAGFLLSREAESVLQQLLESAKAAVMDLSALLKAGRPLQELLLGCGINDLDGITQATMNNRDAVQKLVRAMAELLPGAAFHTMAVLRAPDNLIDHGTCLRAPASEFFIVPLLAPGAWLWFQSPTGDVEVDTGETKLLGTWMELRRTTCITASSHYKLYLPPRQLCVVVYKSGLVLSKDMLEELVHLEFPLDDDDLLLFDEHTSEADPGAAECPRPQEAALGNAEDSQNQDRSKVQVADRATTRSRPIGAPGPAAPMRYSPTQAEQNRPVREVHKAQHSDGFETWVKNKLIAIERKQSEILAILKANSPHPREEPPRSSAGPFVSGRAPSIGTLQRTAIGARPATGAPSSTALPKQRIVPIRRGGKAAHNGSRSRRSLKISNELVKGGGSESTNRLEGSLWARSIECWRKQKNDKRVLICCGKAKPVMFSYSGSISSRHLIQAYAAEKRVGRPYIAIKLRQKDGSTRSIAYADKPVYANWHNRKIHLTNNRYHALGKMSVGERKKLEMDTDELVDSLPVPTVPRLSQHDVDDLPIMVQKCAEKMLGEHVDRQKPCDRGAASSMGPPPLPRSASTLADKKKPASPGHTERASSADKQRRSRDHAVTEPACPMVHIHFSCVARVPKAWALGQVLDMVRSELRPENCVLTTPPNHLSIQLTVTPDEKDTVVQGAGRSLRVQRDTVALNALTRLHADLKQCQCPDLEPALIRMLLLRDRKCALAVFQSRTQAHRMLATIAALKRMGLPDKALVIEKALPHASQNEDSTNDSEHQVDTGANAQLSGDTGSLPGRSSPIPRQQLDAGKTVSKLEQRIAAMEAWAHALDAQLETDEDLADRSTFKAREMLELMAVQAVKDARQDRDYMLEQQVVALTSKIDRVNLSLDYASPPGERRTTAEDSEWTGRIMVLEKKIQECLVGYATLLQNQAEQDADSCAAGNQTPTVKITSLEHQLDLCMRMSQTLLQQHTALEANISSALNSQAKEQQQIGELVRMHTAAISRTWQWTAAACQAITALQQRNGADSSSHITAQVRAQDTHRSHPARNRSAEARARVPPVPLLHLRICNAWRHNWKEVLAALGQPSGVPCPTPRTLQPQGNLASALDGEGCPEEPATTLSDSMPNADSMEMDQSLPNSSTLAGSGATSELPQLPLEVVELSDGE